MKLYWKGLPSTSGIQKVLLEGVTARTSETKLPFPSALSMEARNCVPALNGRNVILAVPEDVELSQLENGMGMYMGVAKKGTMLSVRGKSGAGVAEKFTCREPHCSTDENETDENPHETSRRKKPKSTKTDAYLCIV